MSPLQIDKLPRFSLDVSSVASLLGGDDTVAAMTAVHVHGNSHWLGWYNNPGSFWVAERLSSFAKSASFHSISSVNLTLESSQTRSIHMDPSTLLKLDNCKGPKFHATHSDTVIEKTGYLASLFMKECAAWDSEGIAVPGRWTQPVGVTIADLGPASASVVQHARNNAFTLFFASIPIIVSVGACVLCALHNDWYASLRIFLGISTSGISRFILGSADLVLTHPEPANGLSTGDGVLSSDNGIVLLRGAEEDVNCITRGRFSLRFSCEDHYNLIRFCSVLYFIQGVTQLFLIPHPTLFGHVMYLASLGMSALYNAWLSSLNKEHSLRRILFKGVLGNPTLTRYTLGTRTAAVVFALLVLQPQDPTELLKELLPDDTKVWRLWKATILEWLRHPNEQSFQLGGMFVDLNGFNQEEKDLLGLLYEDARVAYSGYRNYVRPDSQ